MILSEQNRCTVALDDRLADYHFGEDHPFGPKRYWAFKDALLKSGIPFNNMSVNAATEAQLNWFHSVEYIHKVIEQSQTGRGYLDQGDTPARKGIYEVACLVAGATLGAAQKIVAGECQRAFVPIAGLHHARRDGASGFCVFNDCAIAIEWLLRDSGLQRIAYVDIDAHHGDGVFYGFADEPRLIFADVHEDGHYLFPGTGFSKEQGVGKAIGTKLNIPMKPGAGDNEFMQAWLRVETFIDEHEPEFIMFQCGADSLEGDPLTHLEYSVQAHRHAAQRLSRLADKHAHGRLLALGGGGYNLSNIAQGWTAVVKALSSEY